MPKKVAVFLRGHLRTWDYIKHINFKFFDSLPWEVDYYLATWTYPNEKIQSLKNDFTGKNLKVLKVFKREQGYDPWKGPAHMSSELSKFRINEQLLNGTEYEFVIETRFDIVLNLKTEPEIPSDQGFGSTQIQGAYIPGVNDIVSGLDDHCFVSKVGPLQIMNSRDLMDPGTDGNHISLLKFAVVHGLIPFKINWFDALISRPNVSFLRKTKQQTIENIHRLKEEWNATSETDKLDIIKKANIDPYDYAEFYHVGNILRNSNGL
jgi:hypothetical protein